MPLSPGHFGLLQDALGRLVLIDSDGRRHVDVEPVCGFPLTDPRRAISIRSPSGAELAFVDDPGELPPAVRETLQRDLAQRDFVPLIRRIVKISGDREPTHWDVETDRGRVCFTLLSDEHVRPLGPQRVLIVDQHGVRYLAPDVSALDGASRRLLQRYL